jgi:multiple sugar transport system permease protein
MLQNFSLLELVIYAILWSTIGGLPGFYLFFTLNRNPRYGAWIGIGVGLLVGFGGALIGAFISAADLINATLLLWLVVLIIGIVLTTLGLGRGNHNQTASLRQRITDFAYGLLLPTFAIVMAIVVFPMIWNIVLAFRPVRLRDLPDLQLFALNDLSLVNFERMLNTRGFTDTLLRTFIYTITGTLLAILMGFLAALVVKDSFRGRNIVRGFMLFPYIAPIVSVALIWQLLLNAQFGLVNEMIDAFGGRRTDFLNTPGVAFTFVILFQAWRYFPFAFLFILARIQAIPDDIYEAAKVDGAAPSQRLWHVTLPQLRAVFGTLFLLRFIWTFNKFDDVYLLTGGAAGTKLITIEVYDQLFGARNVGAASATALILAAVLIVVVLIYFRWFMVEEN